MFTFIIKLYLELINFLQYIFSGRIKGLVKKDTTEIITYKFLNYIPYRWYLPFIDEDEYLYYYELNGKYYLSSKTIRISPMIISIFVLNDETDIDITYIYTKYVNTFPLWLVIAIENLEEYSILKVTKSGFIEDKTELINIERNKYHELASLYNLKYIK
jgi:hypothetical protein